MRAEMTHMPPGSTLTVRNTEAGQLGTVAPMAMSDPVIYAGTNDIDTYRCRATSTRRRVTSSNITQSTEDHCSCLDNCPVPQAELANYRKTIVKYIDKPNEQYIEEARKSLNNKQQKRLLPGFEVQPGARKRYNEQVLKAQQMTTAQPEQNKGASKGPKRTTLALRAEQQLAEAFTGDTKPIRRLTSKTAGHEVFKQGSTSLPAPQTLQPNDDYGIREGTHWKHVHVKPMTALNRPEQTDDGPDISKLTPYRSTLAKQTLGERLNRFDDKWTGSTNFDEEQSMN